MIFGSHKGNKSIREPIAASFAESSFSVTSDQISESYTVANIASSISLPSTSTISENYVTASAIYASTGVAHTSGVPDKPVQIDVSDIPIGVIVYTVVQGDSIESVLKKNNITGVTTDQVRWSNNLKTKALKVGQKLYLPSQPGIVYVVKKGDTLDGIAKKYQSNKDRIIMANNLETTKKVASGMVLLLPDGVLPTTERPEYVAPVVRPTTNYNLTYTYAFESSGMRHNMIQVGNYGYWANQYYATSSWKNPGAFGNCTWFAWYWRRKNMPSNYWLPTGAIGNAYSWASTMSARGYVVNKTPAYGAVFQSYSGAWGHVGVVVGVNPGVSITIQEMNYAGPNGMYNTVYQSTVYWKDALSLNYIHARR